MRVSACCALLLLLAAPAAQAANAEAEPADVTATYERGKAAYDRGDYAEALREFDRAAQADPTRARWQYNRGLALKKLGRNGEAIEALHRSRALDPGYKVAEIDKKLSDLGESSGSGGGAASGEEGGFSPGLIVGAFMGFGFLLMFVLVGVTMKKAAKEAAALRPEVLQQRLSALGERLIKLEHRFSRGEDAEARRQLDWATAQEAQARKLLPKATVNAKKARALAACLEVAEKAAAECEARLEAAWGPDPRTIGERVGCWFCARPLANEASRVAVQLELGGQAVEAAACAGCAVLAREGRAPRVTMVPVQGGLRHWSQVPGFDPYRHRHQPSPDVQTARLHKVASGLDLGALARPALAVDAAVAAGAVLLDLAALSEASAAEAAAQASASGGGRNGWADQS